MPKGNRGSRSLRFKKRDEGGVSKSQLLIHDNPQHSPTMRKAASPANKLKLPPIKGAIPNKLGSPAKGSRERANQFARQEDGEPEIGQLSHYYPDR